MLVLLFLFSFWLPILSGGFPFNVYKARELYSRLQRGSGPWDPRSLWSLCSVDCHFPLLLLLLTRKSCIAGCSEDWVLGTFDPCGLCTVSIASLQRGLGPWGLRSLWSLCSLDCHSPVSLFLRERAVQQAAARIESLGPLIPAVSVQS